VLCERVFSARSSGVETVDVAVFNFGFFNLEKGVRGFELVAARSTVFEIVLQLIMIYSSMTW